MRSLPASLVWKAYTDGYEPVPPTPSISYTEVGSPTITNYVASGFSGNDYLSLDDTFNPSTSPWEINLKIKTSESSSSGSEYYFGSTNGANGLLLGYKNGYMKFWLSSNGTSWDLASSVGTYAVSPSTDYYVKMGFYGYHYEMQVSTDGQNWTSGGTVASSTPIHSTNIYIGACWDRATRYMKANGSVDLMSSSIDIVSTSPSTSIDADTMVLWHFDDSVTDASQYASSGTYTGNPTYVFDTGKFGKDLYSINFSDLQYTNSSFSGTINQYTFDYWYKVNGGSKLQDGIIILNDSTNNKSLGLYIGRDSWSGPEWYSIYVDSTDIAYMVNFKNFSCNTGDFNHIAVEVDNTNKFVRLYCNGFLENKISVPSMSFSNIEKVFIPYGNFSSDEFRLSKSLRYDGKLFVPPTQAYS